MKYSILDIESGIVLIYNWDDEQGWSFVVSAYETREDMRKAITLSVKYWPQIPSEYEEEINKYNQHMIDVCRSLKIE